MMLEWLHKLGLPPVASVHGVAVDVAQAGVHWLMLVLFVGWMGYFIFVLFRFRRSRNPQANYQGVKSHFSTYVEVAVVVAEAVLLLGFSIPMWRQRVEAFPSASQATVIRIVAEQFAWNIHYPGPDGIFGRTDPKLIDLTSNPLGLDRNDPNAMDDITNVNQLHLPVNKPVIIHLSSKDVIHSFGIPQMRIKQDAIPGMSVPIWFTPSVTSEEMKKKTNDDKFQYQIACAQLCGLGHYRMAGYVTIESQEAFDTWLDEQGAKAQTSGDDAFWL